MRTLFKLHYSCGHEDSDNEFTDSSQQLVCEKQGPVVFGIALLVKWHAESRNLCSHSANRPCVPSDRFFLKFSLLKI